MIDGNTNSQRSPRRQKLRSPIALPDVSWACSMLRLTSSQRYVTCSSMDGLDKKGLSLHDEARFLRRIITNTEKPEFGTRRQSRWPQTTVPPTTPARVDTSSPTLWPQKPGNVAGARTAGSA